MASRRDTGLVLSAVASVALWVAGVVLGIIVPNEPNGGTTSDATYLTYLHNHDNAIIAGSWLFMAGCITFIVFGAFLRDRLVRYEGGSGITTSIAYAGSIGFGVMAMGAFLPKAAIAINAHEVSGSTVATLFHLTDGFFMAAELLAILPTAALAVIAFRTGVVPKWWAAFSALLALVLFIGPIGWAGLMFGVPVWTLVTGCMLGLRRTRTLQVGAVAPVAS